MSSTPFNFNQGKEIIQSAIPLRHDHSPFLSLLTGFDEYTHYNTNPHGTRETRHDTAEPRNSHKNASHSHVEESTHITTTIGFLEPPHISQQMASRSK